MTGIVIAGLVYSRRAHVQFYFCPHIEAVTCGIYYPSKTSQIPPLIFVRSATADLQEISRSHVSSTAKCGSRMLDSESKASHNLIEVTKGNPTLSLMPGKYSNRLCSFHSVFQRYDRHVERVECSRGDFVQCSLEVSRI